MLRLHQIGKTVLRSSKFRLPVVAVTFASVLAIKTYQLQSRKTRCDAFVVSPQRIVPHVSVVCKSSFVGSVVKVTKEVAQKVYDAVAYWLNLLLRATVVGFIYSPAIISLPLLITQSESLRDTWWAITRYCLANGGPCSIKFAQWLSTRPDLFPIHVCKQLQSLQSNTTLPNWRDIEPILVRHFGEDYSTFIEIEMNEGDKDKTPLIVGSGCVAYVLKGKLLKYKPVVQPSGTAALSVDEDPNGYTDQTVAIKITHPGVNDIIHADIELMRFASSFLEYTLPSIKNISLVDSVEEFNALMTRQLDMREEGRSLEKFRVNFNIDPPKEEVRKVKQTIKERVTTFIEEALIFVDKTAQFVTNTNIHNVQNEVTFPAPLWEFTSHDILVETYEDGILMHDLMRLTDTPTKKKVAQIGLDAIFKMIFIDNFIHADLHPGNIICLKQQQHNAKDITPKAPIHNLADEYSIGLNPGQKLQLSFIDAGLVVSLEPTDRMNFLDLFKAIIMNDGYNVGRLMIERSRGPKTVINPEEFSQEMETIVGSVHETGLVLGKVGINSLLQKVLILCYQHQVKLESRFVSVVVAIGVLEGMGRQLDPEVDILKKVTPYVLRAATEQLLFQK